MNNQSQAPRVNIHASANAGGQGNSASATRLGEKVDASGRRILVKGLSPLEVYRLAKIMGEAADSGFARNYAAIAASVREIDGEPEAFPNSDREIEAMLQRLGEEGLDTVAAALEELSKSKPKSNKDAVKN